MYKAEFMCGFCTMNSAFLLHLLMQKVQVVKIYEKKIKKC